MILCVCFNNWSRMGRGLFALPLPVLNCEKVDPISLVAKCKVVAISFMLLACSDTIVPREIDSSKIELTEIYRDQGNAWEATLDDFDRDGHVDILINGHNKNDRIRYFRDGRYVPSSFVFSPANDRHACDSSDIDLDGWPDLYCTTGAKRGTSSNNNELWMGVDGVNYRKRRDSFGALAPTGRGRQVAFFNYDGDEYPDLYVTNWSGRLDHLPNENSVFLNQGDGNFRKIDSALNGNHGVRCVAAGDINSDGLDDLIICGEERGGSLFLSDGNDRTRINIPGSEFWWIDARLSDVNSDGKIDLIILNHRNEVHVRLNDGSQSPYQITDKRIQLEGNRLVSFIRSRLKERPFTSSLALADINKDGFLDIYAARRVLLDKSGIHMDLPDRILLGPNFDRYIRIPAASSGASHLAYGMNDRFLVLNSGESWQGSVNIVSMSIETEPHSPRTIEEVGQARP